jgi:IclR family KDG regulon transcriptional repressor
MNYIEKTGDSKFRLSFKTFILGNTIPLKDQIIDIAHPYMIRLAEISQENVNLAVMFERKLLYIDKIESSQYLKLDQPIGRTDPLHCTALGKIFFRHERPRARNVSGYNKLVRYTRIRF